MHSTDDLWSGAWRDPDVANRQWDATKDEIDKWCDGGNHPAFDPFVKLLKRIGASDDVIGDVLEVGCGCGYYADVVFFAGFSCAFAGVDISEEAIEIAHENFASRGADFSVGDACDLHWTDGSFDVVVLGSIIGHVADWKAAIAEAGRVSSRYVMLHRVQCHNAAITSGADVFEYTKSAYGVEMAERSFYDESLLKNAANIIGGEVVGNPLTWSRTLKSWQMSCLLEKR